MTLPVHFAAEEPGAREADDHATALSLSRTVHIAHCTTFDTNYKQENTRYKNFGGIHLWVTLV